MITTNSIFIYKDQQEYGPYSVEQVMDFLVAGNILASDHARTAFSTEWSTVTATLTELKARATLLEPRSVASTASEAGQPDSLTSSSVPASQPAVIPDPAIQMPPQAPKAKEEFGIQQGCGCLTMIIIVVIVLHSCLSGTAPKVTTDRSTVPTEVDVREGVDNAGYHNLAFNDLASVQEYWTQVDRGVATAMQPFNQFTHQHDVQRDIDNPQVAAIAKEFLDEAQREIAKVSKRVGDKLLANGKAILLPSGTYKIDAYFDQTGVETVPKSVAGGWYAADGNGVYVRIHYNNMPCYYLLSIPQQ